MPEDEQNHSPSQNNDPGFTKRVVETPIFGSATRDRLAAVDEERMAPTKSFYQTNKIYVWAIVAGIIMISLLSYFAFRKGPVAAPKQANVAINVDVPQTVPSGGDAVYKITIQNNDTQKLVNMQLELVYPQGLAYESSVPNANDISGDLFNVPDLIPGQNAVVIVKAKATGNVGDNLSLDIKLNYEFNGLSSSFTKEQTSSIQLAASNIIIQLQGPSTTNNAQLVLYTVNYENNSGATIANGQLKMNYPSGFVFASASPPPDLGSDTWTISNLANNASSTISIQGSFASANPGESETATANFLILGPDGNYFNQNSSSFTTGISSLPLLVTQVLSPANSTNVIKPGDDLTYDITYQNNASTAATGVNIEVDLNSKSINASSIQAQGGQVNNNSIIWNASGVPELATLLPNQSGQLSFSVHVNNPATKDSSTDLNVVSNIDIKSNEYSTPFPGNQLTLKISSPVVVNTAISYLSGQLPPEVGKNTVYQVSLSLTNSSNDFSSGSVTASMPLPAGSFSQSSVNSGESSNVQLNPSTGQLTWNFGGLPANAGRFTSPRTLTFDLTLNPSSSEVQQPVTLLKNISLSATDNYTTQNVTASANDISTSDITGQNSYQNGIVVP